MPYITGGLKLRIRQMGYVIHVGRVLSDDIGIEGRIT